MLEDMTVEIDETRQNRRPVCGDDLSCPHAVKASDRRNFSIRHGNVAPLVDAQNWITDTGFANQKIALCCHDIPPDAGEHSASDFRAPQHTRGMHCRHRNDALDTVAPAQYML